MKKTTVAIRVCITAALCFASILAAHAAQTYTLTNQADRQESVEFDVFLPLQNSAQLDQLLEAQQTVGSANYHKWLTPQEFKTSFGPKPDDVAKVTAELQRLGFTIVNNHTQSIHVAGNVDMVESAFGVSLLHANVGNGRQALVASGKLNLPAALNQAGAQIVKFSVLAPHHVHAHSLGVVPANRNSPTGFYWFDDFKQAYDFPSYLALNGKGTTIAVVMSSDYSQNDINTYFAHELVTPPTILRLPVDGGAPFDPVHNTSAALEVSLDLQQTGGMAPKATIIDCIIPDLSDPSILDGYQTLIDLDQADIISSSFGGPELAGYSAEYNGGVDFSFIPRDIYGSVFRQGNAQGITFVASSGDNGGLASPSLSYFTTPPQNPPVITAIWLPDVEFPASSPYVTGVGGTDLITKYDPPSLNSSYVRESAYSDPDVPYDPYGFGNLVEGGVWGSGGGESTFFKKPSYQISVNTGSPQRTVPDLSLFMGGCPAVIAITAYCSPDDGGAVVRFNGLYYGVIGTSISAPDFAGLLALEEQYLGGRLGNVNYLIYLLASLQAAGGHTYFHQNIPGFNGYFSTQPGYNLVLGNGTIDGRQFILAPNLPAAGNPQTPSNP